MQTSKLLRFFLSATVVMCVACGPPVGNQEGSRNRLPSDGPSFDSGTQALTCFDGLQNGNESDRDCGGDCVPCSDGHACLQPSDCLSGHCDEGICSAQGDAGSPAPRCDDGLHNGSETDRDCGGDCAPCADGLNCIRDRDCIHERCDQGICRARVCSPGQRVCDGSYSRLCNERGDGYVEDSNEDCDARGLPCEDGQCVVPNCRDLDCLANRSATLVCDLYRDSLLRNTRNPFRSGASSCDPGTLTAAAYDEALRAANYGRWLTGLPDVAFAQALQPRTQACAAMMSNQRSLSHDPPRSWACYTEPGAQAAGESNLGLSYSSETIAKSVVRFFLDGGANNQNDVGHRRWLQSPTLGAVGFGYHEASSGASASCYNVIAGQAVGATGPEFIAYPSPGPFPIELVTSRFWAIPWSVSIDIPYATRLPATDAWEVVVSRQDGDRLVPVPVRQISSSAPWYGRTRAVVFTPDFTVRAGSYRIEVEAPGYRFVWDTELVDCTP